MRDTVATAALAAIAESHATDCLVLLRAARFEDEDGAIASQMHALRGALGERSALLAAQRSRLGAPADCAPTHLLPSLTCSRRSLGRHHVR
eukprot:COSAG01_NODE_16076_length_1272_cov_1.993180_2_plen_91_part_00